MLDVRLVRFGLLENAVLESVIKILLMEMVWSCRLRFHHTTAQLNAVALVQVNQRQLAIYPFDVVLEMMHDLPDVMIVFDIVSGEDHFFC